MTAVLPPRPPPLLPYWLRVLCSWPFSIMATVLGSLMWLLGKALHFLCVTVIQILGEDSSPRHQRLLELLQLAIDWSNGRCVGCRHLEAELRETEEFLGAWRCECGRSFFLQAEEPPAS